MDSLMKWYEEGVSKGASHMIVAYDTFSRDTYPVYVMPGEDVREIVKWYGNNDIHGLPKLENVNMSKVDAIYLLSEPFQKQYSQGTPFNFG